MPTATLPTKTNRESYAIKRALIQENPKKIFRDLRDYLAGQFVGGTRDEVLLDEVLKCLFCKFYIEVNSIKHIDVDQISLAQFYRSIFAKVRNDFSDIYTKDDEILLDPRSLQEVVTSLTFNILDADSDPIGDAYEVFAGSESRAKSGQFFTPRTATDFLVNAINPQLGEAIIDPACGAAGFLASVARHFARNGASAEEIEKASRKLHGIEKDHYLSKLARLHVALLTGGHPHIYCGDSLAFRDEQGLPLQKNLANNGYDVVLTNPPFGANIVAANPEVLRSFQLARKWKLNKKTQVWETTDEEKDHVPPQVLFVERCIELLREGGRMGIVLPESLLSNKSYRYVVEYTKGRARIEAVIGMPESLFKTSGKGGTHTKTCLLILTKHTKTQNNGKIFMAEAKWCGHDSRAREIPHNDLPIIAKNFRSYKDGAYSESSNLGFVIEEKSIDGNVLCPRYHDPELENEVAKLSSTHDLLNFGTLVDEGVISLQTGDEVGKLAYGTGNVPFIRTSDISNWEIKFDPKHCLDRNLYLSLKDKQDVQPMDILMVRDGTYLIGTCAIVTEYDQEIVYQSHIYKIRVNENKYDLNPYLLLAILGTPMVQKQIKAKQFTQDIIDSLGDRINELVLPVPRSAKLRAKISDMVKQAVEDRIRARELARKARLEVLLSDA
jgi:type I restriction enzyme M protein